MAGTELIMPLLRMQASLAITAATAVFTSIISGCTSLSNGPDARKDSMIRANNFQNGKFHNSEPTTVIKRGSLWSSTYQFLFKGHKERTPQLPLPVVSLNGYAREAASPHLRFAWLGHASVLVELGGKRILVDPVFSERASFIQWAGPKRFQPPPVRTQDFPMYRFA
jgi:hypothetical protein